MASFADWYLLGQSLLEHAFTVDVQQVGWENYDGAIEAAKVTKQGEKCVSLSLIIYDFAIKRYHNGYEILSTR